MQLLQEKTNNRCSRIHTVLIRYSHGIQEALDFHQKLFTLPRTVRHASAHAVVAMGWLSVFNCFSIDAQVHSWPFFASASSQICENSESACYGRIYWTHFLASCPHLGPSWPHLGPSLNPFWPVLNLYLRRQNPSLLPSFPKGTAQFHTFDHFRCQLQLY